MIDDLPQATIRLTDATVELFHVELNPPARVVEWCRSLLSSEEQVRADRFVTDQLTRRFTVCRGVLRQILSAALAIPPQELRISVGPHGKPSLHVEQSAVQFNVSHTADVALIALTKSRSVGVDVESISDRPSQDDLANRFFSAAERQVYFALPASQRQTAFFRIWTCKEAFLKATGTGLSFPLGRFTVSAAPDQPPGLLHVDGDPAATQRWSFVVPEVAHGLVAALAVEGHGWTLRSRLWQNR